MQTTIKRTYNVNRLVQIEALTGMVFQAESGGHLFEISGSDNAGEAVALSGTVSGVFLRPDNTDVALSGSVSGGVVSVPLKAECYAVPGRFGLTLYISAGGNKTAIYAAMGTVSRTSSGQVAPTVTADVVDLVNRIAAAVNSIPATYADLQADIAPTYSDTAVYAVGQFAWYNGDLKRCKTAITTPETYTAAHWENGVLGNDLNADITGLKSAIDDNLFKGINELYTFTGADTRKFALEMNSNIFYTITNNTQSAISIRVYKTYESDENIVIASGLAVGKSALFLPDENYGALGIYSSTAGTVSVKADSFNDRIASIEYADMSKVVNGSYTGTNSNKPSLIYNKTRLRLIDFIVFDSDGYIVFNGGTTLGSNITVWSGVPGSASLVSAESGFTTGNRQVKIYAHSFVMITFANPTNTSTPITKNDFNGYVKIIANAKYLANNDPLNVNICTYNTGWFGGIGFDSGSDEAKIAYTAAISKANPDILAAQEDQQYFSGTVLPYDAVYKNLFAHNARQGTGYYYSVSTNYDVVLDLLVTFPNSATLSHKNFEHVQIMAKGKIINIINVHFDWTDITKRHNQISYVIDYISILDNVVVLGDFNPSNRVNGEQVDPEVPIIPDEDFALWTSAGYQIANCGNYGRFNTMWDDTYQTWFPYDQIVVSSDIKIKSVKMVKEEWMNDHCPLSAEICIYE